METIKITMELRFGSNFQRETALGTLLLYLKVWREFRLGLHQKNVINIKINDDTVEKYMLENKLIKELNGQAIKR